MEVVFGVFVVEVMVYGVEMIVVVGQCGYMDQVFDEDVGQFDEQIEIGDCSDYVREGFVDLFVYVFVFQLVGYVVGGFVGMLFGY